MPDSSFGFVHTSDWHLEAVGAGLGEVPDAWRDRLIDAPLAAARAVIDAALAHEVDFVLLCGDILDAAGAGPRGLAFLSEQFERLSQHHIAAYWCGGPAEAAGPWPAGLALPPDVRTFSDQAWQTHVHRRDRAPLVRIVGRSTHDRPLQLPDDLPPLAPAAGDDGSALATLVLAHGAGQSAGWTGRGVDYVAGGGDHERRLVPATPTILHWPGTPQGRSLDECGAHGASLVQVDADRQVRVVALPADKLRWHDERLEIDDAHNDGEVERLVAERTASLAAGSAGLDAIVRWTVVVSPERATSLRAAGRLAELTNRLRNQFAAARPGVWVDRIAVESRAPFAVAADDETVLGHYLRRLGELAEADAAPFDLAGLVGGPQRADALAPALAWSDRQVRARAAAEAAQLGLELLRPHREEGP